LLERPERTKPLWNPKDRLEENIRMDLGEIEWGIMDRVHVAQDRGKWRALVNTVMDLRVSQNIGKFLSS
jgi:hypothetical protein